MERISSSLQQLAGPPGGSATLAAKPKARAKTDRDRKPEGSISGILCSEGLQRRSPVLTRLLCKPLSMLG